MFFIPTLSRGRTTRRHKPLNAARSMLGTFPQRHSATRHELEIPTPLPSIPSHLRRNLLPRRVPGSTSLLWPSRYSAKLGSVWLVLEQARRMTRQDSCHVTDCGQEGRRYAVQITSSPGAFLQGGGILSLAGLSPTVFLVLLFPVSVLNDSYRSEPPYEQTAEGAELNSEHGILDRCPQENSKNSPKHQSQKCVVAQYTLHFDPP
jgi:hypothetical protein